MTRSKTAHTVEVDVPIGTAYNQWTQFEEFPRFMKGVKEVVQRGDDMVHFKVEIAGRTIEYDAEIVDQIPDKKVEWRSRAGKDTGGIVEFEPVSPGRCRVTLDMSYAPEGLLENVGDLLGLVSNRTRQDLESFKRFIEERGRETGAWRGEIHKR